MNYTTIKAFIKFRRGEKSNLPELLPGEPGFCLDTGDFYIGSPTGNIYIGNFNKILEILENIEPSSLGDIEIVNNDNDEKVRIIEKGNAKGIEIYAKNGDLILSTDPDILKTSYYEYFSEELKQESTNLDIKILSVWDIILKAINKISLEAYEISFKPKGSPALIDGDLEITGNLINKGQLILPGGETGLYSSINEAAEHNLIHYYNFNEVSGSIVRDIIAENNGVANGTQIVETELGKGRLFNGSSEYIELSSPIYLPDNCTYGAWFTKYGDGPIFGEQVSGRYNILIWADGSRIHVSQPGGVYQVWWNIEPLNEGKHLILITQQDKQNLNLYIDNVDYGPPSDGNVGPVLPDGSGPITFIGRGSSIFFNGIIDESFVWSVVLNTEEKTSIYNHGSGIPLVIV